MTIKEKIKELLSKSKQSEAIRLAYSTLPSGEVKNSISLLSARQVRNDDDNAGGVILHADFLNENNKIGKALLYFIEDSSAAQYLNSTWIEGSIAIEEPPKAQYREPYQEIQAPNLKSVANDNFSNSDVLVLEQNVYTFIAQLKRVQAKQKADALEIIKKITEYKLQKATKAVHDSSGRRLKILVKEFEDLKESAIEAKDLSREEFIETVSGYISETVPTWRNIKLAYELCNAKGFDKEGCIAAIISKKSDSAEIKCDVVDEIEGFLKTL